MNRRSVLGITATTAVGIALSQARIFAQASGPGPEMSALSAYMSAAGTRALPADAAEHAKDHLLDTLASMISGSELPPGQAALRYIRSHAGKGAATISGAALTAAPVDAALANGVMAHADETDDSHIASRSHPGCAVVPAALAAGEEFGIDGARFLRAVTLGYDIGTRVVMAVGGASFSYESSLATHSIAGTFCAAAAAACAAGLDAREMRWALDYTAQQSSGIVAWRRDTDHIEKAFVFGGMPARSGVTSALLVRSGWNGVDDIFTGAGNFFQAYAPKAQRAQLVEKLGERYEIALTDIKKWTVGSPIQGPLDAVEAIRNQRPFDADQVRRVTVRLAPSVAAVVDNRDMPDICLQHMIAVMLLDKTVSFHAAHRVQTTQQELPETHHRLEYPYGIGFPFCSVFRQIRGAIGNSNGPSCSSALAAAAPPVNPPSTHNPNLPRHKLMIPQPQQLALRGLAGSGAQKQLENPLPHFLH